MDKGFTLVELAIVMTIIGLLIGGILKGQKMVENARVTATISQFKSYKAAVTIFRDKHNSMPGDFSTATSRLPNCVTATNNCRNGDNSGIIGLGGTSGGGWNSGGWWNSDESGLDTEATQFWKHLLLSDLISGVKDSSTQPEWGSSHPSSSAGGGVHLNFLNQLAGGIDTMNGHSFRIQGNVTGDPNLNGYHPVNGIFASQVDRKIDDGNPAKGDIQTEGPGPTRDCGLPSSGYETYDIEGKDCVLYYLFE